MVLEIDLAVLSPHRVMELEWNVDELIAEGVEFVEPAVDDLTKLIDPELTALQIVELDHRQLQGVHVHCGRLAVQQHSVPPAKPLHPASPCPEEPT